MFDFRLKVFHTVARRLNFTKAAEELFITQPAVTKHIHEIEAYYQCKLFERNGTKIKLTYSGITLLKYTEELFEVYRNIEFDLAAINETIKGIIRIGASNTIAQYILPKYLAVFKQKFPEIKIELISGNTETIEHLLTENKIDIGLVEGQSKRKNIKYTPFIKDEMVLTAATTTSLSKKTTITVNDLKTLSFVMREQGSGSLEVVIAALKNHGIKFTQLIVDIVFESSESIKSYLLNSTSFAFLSVHSILEELKSNKLKIVDIKGLNIERYFYIISQQGDTHHLHEKLIRFISSYNFKL